jgi:hypothetical protein
LFFIRLSCGRGLAKQMPYLIRKSRRSLTMSRASIKPIPKVTCISMLSLLVVSVAALAQDPAASPPPAEAPPQQSSAPTPGWHRFSQPSPRQAATNPQQSSAQDPNTIQGNGYDSGPRNGPANNPTDEGIPSRLTLKTGTFVTVRVDQFLSSDKSQAGDGFSATLTRPLVVDGLVVAERGQTLGGRVVEAKKAGRVKGVSRLSVQLTDLTLVDGQQVPIKTQLASMTAGTSNGRDAAAIGTTTVTGAAIGAAADWGTGAAIGAGAGALAGVIGVLVTRGRPTVIYPETLLTFRLAAPASFSTDRAPQAFHYMDTSQYERPAEQQGPPPAPCAGYGCPPPPYYYGYYGPFYYPYFWGPSFSFWYGRGYYGRGFYGRGFYSRGFGYRR